MHFPNTWWEWIRRLWSDEPTPVMVKACGLDVPAEETPAAGDQVKAEPRFAVRPPLETEQQVRDALEEKRQELIAPDVEEGGIRYYAILTQIHALEELLSSLTDRQRPQHQVQLTLRRHAAATTGWVRLYDVIRETDHSGVSGVGRVAQVVEWTEGKCVVQWLPGSASGVQSTAIFDTLEQVAQVHGHGGSTKLVKVAEWQLSGPQGGTLRPDPCGRQFLPTLSPRWRKYMEANGLVKPCTPSCGCSPESDPGEPASEEEPEVTAAAVFPAQPRILRVGQREVQRALIVTPQGRLTLEDLWRAEVPDVDVDHISTETWEQITLGVDVGRQLTYRLSAQLPEGGPRYVVSLGQVPTWEALDDAMGMVDCCVVAGQPDSLAATQFAQRHPGKVYLASYGPTAPEQPWVIAVDRRAADNALREAIQDGQERWPTRAIRQLDRRAPVEEIHAAVYDRLALGLLAAQRPKAAPTPATYLSLASEAPWAVDQTPLSEWSRERLVGQRYKLREVRPAEGDPLYEPVLRDIDLLNQHVRLLDEEAGHREKLARKAALSNGEFYAQVPDLLATLDARRNLPQHLRCAIAANEPAPPAQVYGDQGWVPANVPPRQAPTAPTTGDSVLPTVPFSTMKTHEVRSHYVNDCHVRCNGMPGNGSRWVSDGNGFRCQTCPLSAGPKPTPEEGAS